MMNSLEGTSTTSSNPQSPEFTLHLLSPNGTPQTLREAVLQSLWNRWESGDIKGYVSGALDESPGPRARNGQGQHVTSTIESALGGLVDGSPREYQLIINTEGTGGETNHGSKGTEDGTNHGTEGAEGDTNDGWTEWEPVHDILTAVQNCMNPLLDSFTLPMSFQPDDEETHFWPTDFKVTLSQVPASIRKAGNGDTEIPASTGHLIHYLEVRSLQVREAGPSTVLNMSGSAGKRRRTRHGQWSLSDQNDTKRDPSLLLDKMTGSGFGSLPRIDLRLRSAGTARTVIQKVSPNVEIMDKDKMLITNSMSMNNPLSIA
ncbi:hypothetical protein BCR39DRAFT_503716 [Naematelia encephala]|uniref:Uncharacterized protein n=1 Tax=Naematelia encephala TaxID=71784 RepID=A0A1Y2BGV7_9TREE|nr:hypothetical protein BCR39DRAFT_503716 [Naematelia encephala]